MNARIHMANAWLRTGVLFLLLLQPLAAWPAGSGNHKLDSANHYYKKKDYRKAAALYEQVLNENEPSAEVYYNLGNTYYRSGSIGLAILNYERAQKINPSDEDIRYNLKIARGKTVDQFEDAGMALGDAWQQFLASVGEAGWSWLTAGALLTTLFVFGWFLFLKKPLARKISFFSGLLLLAVTVFTFTCARQSYQYTYKIRSAVLLQPAVAVYNGPAAGSDQISTLHEGTKVRIRGTEGEWAQIVFGNRAEGWVKANTLAEI